MSASERILSPCQLLMLPLVLLICLGTGCAVTHTQTAHQLEAGEFVLAGTADMPGYLYIPRISAHASLGYGVGDFTARAGSSIGSNFVGLGARIYPADWLNISVDADLAAILAPFSGEDDWARMIVVTPRIYSAASRERRFYGGVQSNIMSLSTSGTVSLFGGFAGLDWRSDRSGLGIQAELTFSPISYNFETRELLAPIFDLDEGFGAFFETTLGVYWSRPPGGRRAQNLPPTQEAPPPRQQEQPKEPQPQRPASPQPPPPIYDENDVPLY